MTPATALNVHKNVPGVLRDVNRIISDLDANIKAQVPRPCQEWDRVRFRLEIG